MEKLTKCIASKEAKSKKKKIPIIVGIVITVIAIPLFFIIGEGGAIIGWLLSVGVIVALAFATIFVLKLVDDVPDAL